MIAPHTGHYCRNAVQGTFSDICAFDVGKVFPREHGVSMTKHDGINTRYFAEVINRVLRHSLIRVGRKARVSHDDDHIRALGPHFRYVLTCGFGDVIHCHFAAEIGFIPGHDLRWHKTDVANFQRLLVTLFVDHLGVFNQIGGKKRFFGFNVDDIGVNVRELRACERLMQILQTVVKFMVAEVADRVIQRIQRLINRVRFAGFQPFRRHVIS